MKLFLMKINWVKIAMMLWALTAGLPVAAERMDQNTHDLIIGKLETALKTLSKSGGERTSVTLRLADLYADRARLQMIAAKGGVEIGRDDRHRAIQLYKDVMPSLNRENQGLALLQMAHLQAQQNQESESVKTLQRAASGQYDAMTTARARGKLGEVKFRKADYAGAEKDFVFALRQNEIPGGGLLTYRLAWSQLNQGKVAQAKATLIHLLQTPELLTVQNQNGSVFDQSFHDDITKDLVIFLARGDVGQKEIDLLINLSPERLRKENLYALANELERLGKKYSATMAWAAYELEGDSSPSDSVEKQIRVAQLQWDMGRKTEALEEYNKAAEQYRKKGCKGEKCEEVNRRFKNFVINWNKTEKDQPSRQCLEAYKTYLKAFNEDAEMFYKAATVADQTKSPQDAWALYAQAAILISQRKDRNSKVNSELLEASLLKQIEAAELSKDKSMRLKAYESYLALNANGPKALEVRYQKAQVLYESGRHQEAFDQFFEIATEKAKDQRPWRVKAADLSLDVLAAQKNDEKLYKISGQLVSHYPERSNEFRKIQRQAAIQMAARALNEKGTRNSELQENNKRLAAMDLKGASQQDTILVYKNRIALSERLKDLSQMNLAADGLLRVKGLSADDREYALGRLAWVAELRLDFNTALNLTRQMKMSKMSQEDKHLRLAMLTDLAGKNPTAEYKNALKVTRNQEKSIGIRATLVRLASNPWSAIREHQSHLQSKPELFSSLVIEAFAKTGNESQARQALKSSSLRNSSLAQLFSTRDLLTNWREIDRNLARHQMYSGSDAVLQKSLTKRMQLLTQVEALGADAVRKADFLGQLAVLMTVERENRRLHGEIMRLPVPKNLKGKDRDQYLKLLQARAETFKVKAEQAKKKVGQFWDNNSTIKQFEVAVRNSEGHTRGLIKQNLLLVSKVAESSERRRIESILDKHSEKPTAQQMARAQAHLKSNPFDTDHIVDLKKIAEQRGQTTMVAFLDARLSQLKQGGVQ